MLLCGYHLAMRRGEILKLRWDQVDWNENLIRLEKRQTKPKKARIAPLYGELRAWLDMAYAARDPQCPYIISWRGHGVSEVKTAWKNACRRAGVPDLLVHDLRRTAARTMIRAGIPEKQIMLIAGWKTRSMFDRYHIVDERDIQEAGKKLARHLAQQECLVKEGTGGGVPK
jgi:integrase